MTIKLMEMTKSKKLRTKLKKLKYLKFLWLYGKCFDIKRKYSYYQLDLEIKEIQEHITLNSF